MVDFDALEAAGVANARERAEVIEYLDGLGFTAEEMVEAESRGRLFALSGDVLPWSGRPTYSLRAAAEIVGAEVDDAARAWSVLGLTVADIDQLALSQADVDVLATWIAFAEALGGEAAFGLLRVVGGTMARLAEAEMSAWMCAQTPDIHITDTRDELASAQAYRAGAELIPDIGAMMDTVHRHHLGRARTYFEAIVRHDSAELVCGIGFADLSGFTELTQVLTSGELLALLAEFNATVTDVVNSLGGRVVKFIGDEVMWVSSTPELLAKAAVGLVEHSKAREAGLHVKAGLGYGEVLAINGDYFGNEVNLAARLVAAAEPGQILATPALNDALPQWPATIQAPLALKGFDAPITPYDLRAER
ncbi:MAG: adenylate/guanylate cyclase domain-containing protein [Actinomycetia bacterium]|nr:adenylate/guanylate cyclase domain-containing protein [Actinomycetes bacterium]